LRHQQAEPPPLARFRSDVPSPLEAALRIMLRKDPAERQQNAAAVAQAVLPWTSGALSVPMAVPMPAISQHARASDRAEDSITPVDSSSMASAGGQSRARRSANRKRFLVAWLVGGAGTLLAVAVAIWLASRPRPTSTPSAIASGGVEQPEPWDPRYDQLPPELQAKTDIMRPSVAERRWQTIPWQHDLEQSLRQAKTEKRPLFIWGTRWGPAGDDWNTRGRMFADETLAAKVSSNFLPVMLAMLSVRDAQDANGSLFRSIREQTKNIAPEKPAVWIVSPTGEVLESLQVGDIKDDLVGPVRSIVDNGLKKFGPVKPRNVMAADMWPSRGAGLRKDGSIGLAWYTRSCINGRIEPSTISAPDEEEVHISEVETKALVPARENTRPGATWEVPPKIVSRFCPHLPGWNVRFAPEAIKSAQCTGTLDKVEGGIVWLNYAGSIEATQKQPDPDTRMTSVKLKIAGRGACSARTGELQTLTLLFEGTGTLGIYEMPVATLVEWRRVPPRR
jgi:hypothetical protein